MHNKAAVYGTAVVLLATAANLLHAISHTGQGVMSLEAWQLGYVAGVIFISPVVAAGHDGVDFGASATREAPAA